MAMHRGTIQCHRFGAVTIGVSIKADTRHQLTPGGRLVDNKIPLSCDSLRACTKSQVQGQVLSH